MQLLAHQAGLHTSSAILDVATQPLRIRLAVLRHLHVCAIVVGYHQLRLDHLLLARFSQGLLLLPGSSSSSKQANRAVTAVVLCGCQPSGQQSHSPWCCWHTGRLHRLEVQVADSLEACQDAAILVALAILGGGGAVLLDVLPAGRRCSREGRYHVTKGTASQNAPSRTSCTCEGSVCCREGAAGLPGWQAGSTVKPNSLGSGLLITTHEQSKTCLLSSCCCALGACLTEGCCLLQVCQAGNHQLVDLLFTPIRYGPCCQVHQHTAG